MGAATVSRNCGLSVHVSGSFGQPPAVSERTAHSPRSESDGSAGSSADSSAPAPAAVASVSVYASVT